jgi:A/G-specific adenine glycosylase
VRAAKWARPRRFGSVFFATRADGAVLVRTRPPRGLLGGMTELPGSEWCATEAFDDADAPFAADWRARGDIDHVFTHFALRLRVFAARSIETGVTPEGCRWAADLDAEALPSVMKKAAALARG